MLDSRLCLMSVLVFGDVLLQSPPFFFFIRTCVTCRWKNSGRTVDKANEKGEEEEEEGWEEDEWDTP